MIREDGVDRVRGLRLGRFLRIPFIAALLAIVVVVATASKTGVQAGAVVRGKLGVQDVRLSMPATDKPLGVAIFFHGQTGGVDNRMDEPWLQALVRSGWIVASSDFHTASWGNPDSTTDTENLVTWATEKTGEPVRLFVSGSMGATVSLNAMTHGVPAPECWYGVKPAVDLTKMGDVPGAVKIINEAYAGAPVPPDRNPINEIAELSPDTRYRIVASNEDTWVKRVENADPLAAGLQARGAEVSTLTVTGTHDDPSHFNAHDLVDFASTCAG